MAPGRLNGSDAVGVHIVETQPTLSAASSRIIGVHIYEGGEAYSRVRRRRHWSMHVKTREHGSTDVPVTCCGIALYRNADSFGRTRQESAARVPARRDWSHLVYSICESYHA